MLGRRLHLPPAVRLSTSQLGVVLTRVEVELRREIARGGARRPRNLPVRPPHDLSEPLHGHGQEAAVPAGAVGFLQLQAAGLSGRSVRIWAKERTALVIPRRGGPVARLVRPVQEGAPVRTSTLPVSSE